MTKILITGAAGQLGSELTQALGNLFGGDNILATDINEGAREKFPYCHFEVLNVMDSERMLELVKKYEITQIYHLAAILSATGEKNPLFTLEIKYGQSSFCIGNCQNENLDKVYWPSSIAVFGTKHSSGH